jgi:hypothetical protein
MFLRVGDVNAIDDAVRLLFESRRPKGRGVTLNNSVAGVYSLQSLAKTIPIINPNVSTDRSKRENGGDVASPKSETRKRKRKKETWSAGETTQRGPERKDNDGGGAFDQSRQSYVITNSEAKEESSSSKMVDPLHLTTSSKSTASIHHLADDAPPLPKVEPSRMMTHEEHGKAQSNLILFDRSLRDIRNMCYLYIAKMKSSSVNKKVPPFDSNGSSLNEHDFAIEMRRVCQLFHVKRYCRTFLFCTLYSVLWGDLFFHLTASNRRHLSILQCIDLVQLC